VPALTAFTGRQLGNLSAGVGDDPRAVAANREALAAQVGAPPERLVWMEQVHGAAVGTVDAPQRFAVPGVDALVTATPGLALVVLVADCVPVLLVDEVAGVAAAVHAGRRGVRLGIVPAAVARMRHLGARGIRALIGPSVGACCYEVGTTVYDDVVAAIPATAARSRGGRPALDLAAGVRTQLAAAGVEVTGAAGGCTADDAGLYSYRRDGVTGRMAGVVLLSP